MLSLQEMNVSRNKQLDLIYGMGHSRIIQKITYPEYSQTKIYVGGNYEKIIENGTTREIHYIAGGSGVCAIFTKNTNGTNEFVYTHLDHLGSIEALTDETGLLVEEYSYDAWGLRRDPNTWIPYDETQTLQTDRGFTGHEHLDLFALVNMNERVYDPVIGYFLSPDPFSQFPGYTQGFNRYSYCLNNPLSVTDPSGYFSCPSINFSVEDVIKGVVIAASILVTIETAGAGAPLQVMLGGAFGGLVSGVGMSMINGGSLNDCISAGLQGAIWGVYSAGLTKGVGKIFGDVTFNINEITWSSFSNELGRAVAHGTVQGAIRASQGGRFEHGFFAGAVSSLSVSMSQSGLNPGVSILVGTTLGGTAEALSGGKFANGAITGAFVVLFNHLHNKPGKINLDEATSDQVLEHLYEVGKWANGNEVNLNDFFSGSKNYYDGNGDFCSFKNVSYEFRFSPDGTLDFSTLSVSSGDITLILSETVIHGNDVIEVSNKVMTAGNGNFTGMFSGRPFYISISGSNSSLFYTGYDTYQGSFPYYIFLDITGRRLATHLTYRFKGQLIQYD
jgi:RHS repeat-associated protein